MIRAEGWGEFARSGLSIYGYGADAFSSIMLLNLVGQTGPFLGTRIFPKSEGPRYIKGQSICAGFMFFNAFLALSLRTLLVWENKKLDKKYGKVGGEGQAAAAAAAAAGVRDGKTGANAGEENYGASYRYIL